MQANASVTHYTAVPLLGDFVTAGQPQGVLLSNPNVNMNLQNVNLQMNPNINWQH